MDPTPMTSTTSNLEPYLQNTINYERGHHISNTLTLGGRH